MAGLRYSPPRALALAATLLALLGAAFYAAASFAAEEEKGVLADLLSRALSTPATEVSIGAIDGALSSDATIRDLKISDRDGVWLTVNRIRIVWRRLALLQRRLEIDKLDVDQMNVVRRRVPAEAPVPGEEQPLLPELPLRVDIKQFSLARVDFDQPVLSVASSFSTGGYVKLGPPSEGLQLFLDAQRLDRPATLNVRLNLVPESQRLDLSVNLDEPAGGILSTLANIPGSPPVKLGIIGSGVLDAFNAKLAFDAGPDAGAQGTAALNREGAGRRLGLDLNAEVSGLLPQIVAPVFAGTTKLTGNVFFGDDSAVTVPSIELAAAAARLEITGGLSAAQIADIKISAKNVPNAGSRTALKNAEFRHLAFDAHITGNLDSPSIDSNLEADGARLLSVSFSHLDAAFRATPSGSIAKTSTVLELAGDAKVKGLALANPALAQAIGSEASLALRGASTLKGAVDFQILEIKSQTLSAGFKGRAGSAELKGRLDVEAPDLARFGAVAGLALKGETVLQAEIEGTPRSNRFTATIDARANRFSTGIASVDGLYGGTLTLTGGARHDPDGGIGFSDLRLNGPNASTRVDGAVTPQAADLNASMTIPDLAKADKRAKGRGEIAARVTGRLSRPDGTASIAISDASLLGRPVPRLDVKADAKDLTGALDAYISLEGELNRKPAHGSLHIARPAAGGVILDGVDVSIGSVLAEGGIALDAANFASGHFTIHARDLDDLSPLALQKLSGSIDADVTLAHADGGQGAAIKADGRKIEAFGASLDKLAADLALTDIYRHPVIAGSLAADEARFGGETISRIRLDAKSGDGASNITLTAAARGVQFDARGKVVATDPIRVEITKFDATRGRNKAGLTRPATLVIKDGGAELRDLTLGLSGGRLTIEGDAGPKLDLKATARAVPLSVASLAEPNLDLSGILDGEASVTGPLAAPSGSYRLRVAKLAAPQTRKIGLPPIDASASGRFEEGRTTLEATFTAARVGTLKISGSAPLSAEGALDLAVKGNLDLGLANQTLSASGQRLTGSLVVDGRAGGTVSQPQATGSITLSKGSLQDEVRGIRLEAIRARLVAQGDRITVESASATTRNGGSITAGGSVRLDPSGGFPGAIRIKGDNAELMQTPLATAILGLDLDIAGPLVRLPRIGGRVAIQSLDIAIPDRLPVSMQPLPGTRHVNPPPSASARLAIAAKKKRGSGAQVFDAALDLTIAVPGQIRVRGRGLDAQLGGELKLTGTLAKPKPVGTFSLIQGQLKLLTSDLDITRANLTFAGDLSPELDFLATAEAGGASVSVAILGNPADPQFVFRSSPDLPQDEILSRLLFGAPSGQLSPTQALTLAQAAAIYSGGNDALEGLRRSLGLGTSSSSNDPLNELLGNRVSLGVHTGATPGQTGVGMSIKIYKQLKAKGAIDAKGGASVGLGTEYEW